MKLDRSLSVDEQKALAEWMAADPARRARMAMAARSRAVESFSLEGMIDRYLNVYDTALARAGVAVAER